MKPEDRWYIDDDVAFAGFEAARTQATQRIVELLSGASDADGYLARNPSTARHFTDQLAASRWQTIALESMTSAGSGDCSGCSSNEDNQDNGRGRGSMSRATNETPASHCDHNNANNNNDNDNGDLEAAIRAFENLAPFNETVPDDFYAEYYARIKRRFVVVTYADEAAIGNLDCYMSSDAVGKSEKYRLLRSLTISLSEITRDLADFNNFEPSDWSWALLLRALIPRDDSWSCERTMVLGREIGMLDIFVRDNAPHYRIEDFLETMIAIRRINGVAADVETMINLAQLLRVSVDSLDVASRDFVTLDALVDDLETLRLRETCKKQDIIYQTESQIQRLRNAMRAYSRETVDATLRGVKRGTAITDLTDFLETLKTSELRDKEDFLLGLRAGRNVDIWMGELYFPLIRSLICREFPAYDDWSCRVGTREARRLADANYFVRRRNDDGQRRSHTTYREVNEAGKNALRRSLTGRDDKALLHAELLNELNRKLAQLLLKCGWSSSTLRIIERWIMRLDDARKLAELATTLDIVHEYDMNIADRELSQLISGSTLANVQKVVHRFAIDSSFRGAEKEKKLGDLIDELVETNNGRGVRLLRNSGAIRSRYDRAVAASYGTSELVDTSKMIKDWSESEISHWGVPFRMQRCLKAANVAEMGLPEAFVLFLAALTMAEKSAMIDRVAATSEHEMIAVIRRAMELTMKRKIRDVQLLSMILLLENVDEPVGRLAQVNTGEGKTTIIAMTAAYHALRGRSVDVVTSSRLLAIPQCEQQSKFYDKLLLTSATNFDSDSDSAYKADIVYGTSCEFQGDILRDEFQKRKNRHGRRCDVAIVDEVDNMLVDGNNHIVMLSTTMPGMDHLEPILAAIHAQVKNAVASTVVENGQTYFVYQDNALDNEGRVRDQVVLHYVPIMGTRRQFVEMTTERHVRRLIREFDDEDEATKVDKNFPEIKIPNHLRKFVREKQLLSWINSALVAEFCCKKDEEYVMMRNEVKIVDADNTGVVQPNMIMSDGLHQFLQIENGVRITPERLTTNFLSNVGYFRRYRPHIYGVSGTLGSEATRKLLANTYDVDTLVVPAFKVDQHRELAAIVEANELDWYSSIARSCLRKLRAGRACLVIMEYISGTDKLRDTLVKEFSCEPNNIRMYRTNEDADVLKSRLRTGEIIVTTNIAGRGTDVELADDVDVHGGLHVCLTFLPKNSRVERQNVGRTSRVGKRGTSQLVLHNAETDVRELRAERDRRDEESMQQMKREIARVTTHDMIFQRFCRLLDDITGRGEFGRDIEKEAVSERFAIWLRMHRGKWDKSEESCWDEACRDFQSFKDAIREDEKASKLIENPYMHVKIGNAYAKKKDYVNAIAEYTAAIKLDKNFAEHAYYYRGFAKIALYGEDLAANERSIDKAVKDLKKARDLITERESALLYEKEASSGKHFIAKIVNKLNLYNLQRNTIDLAIGPDLDAIEARLAELRQRRDTVVEESAAGPTRQEIDTAIEDLEALTRNEGAISSARDCGGDVRVEFRELAKWLTGYEKSYELEVKEFECNGAIGFYSIAVRPPINWFNVWALLALGFCQLILGCALMVFTVGGGAAFSVFLIAEGIKDIIAAVKDCIINRNFSWTSWGIEKAISLVISVYCAGWSTMKDVATTLYSGARLGTAIFSELARQATREGWKIAAKKMAQELCKGIVKRLVTDFVNYGIDETIMPQIQQAIMDRIKGPIERAMLNNRNVRKMLQLDELNGNHHYENWIKKTGGDILQTTLKKDLIYMAKGIATGIADKEVEGFEKSRKIVTAVLALPELVQFTDKFIGTLNGKIDEKANTDKIDERLSIKLEEEARRRGASSNRKLGEPDRRGICGEFVRIVSDSMIKIIQTKIVRPAVDETYKYTSNTLTKDIDEAMNEEMADYRNRNRIIIRH